MSTTADSIRGVVTVLPCRDLDPTLSFFRDELGFRIERIGPADSPTAVVLTGHGATVELRLSSSESATGTLTLLVDEPDARVLTAPNGTRIELQPAQRSVVVPPVQQSFVLSRASGEGAFHVGRAGMGYRDLVPDRQGGRFIASHIRIADGGPVPDYVHYHQVRFQMIFVRRGWVRVVYADQGEPFVMNAGDCVLQPPTIRHRVLESSAGLEVIEVGCPAEHDTLAEHGYGLPTGRTLPDRDYGGQLFVRHSAATSPWLPFRYEGFEYQDLGIGHATHGLAAARVIRPTGGTAWPTAVVDNEFLFTFLLDGTAVLAAGDDTHHLESGDSFVIPADLPYALRDLSPGAEILEVSLPADLDPRLV